MDDLPHRFVARRALAPGAALIALALFSLSPTLIGFGSQVKQYSMDVAMALAMTVLTLRWWERRVTSRGVSDTAFLGVAGFVAVWFSHTTVIVLVALGLALLFEALYQKERVYLRELFPIAILWSGGSLAMLILGTHLRVLERASCQYPRNRERIYYGCGGRSAASSKTNFRYPLPAVAHC